MINVAPPKSTSEESIRPYDRTDEETDMIVKAECVAQLQKKKPEPAPVYTEKQKAYALSFLNTKSQYDLHHKPDDYLRTLQKEVAKSKSSKSSASGKKSASTGASGKKSASTGASGTKTAISKKSDIPLLGQQAKQMIAPLKVVSQNVPLLAQQPVDMSIATELAEAWKLVLMNC